jgi:ATP-dependent Zn protease
MVQQYPPVRSRFPRRNLVYLALVVVLGIVFFITFQAIQGGNAGSAWSYTQLTTQAKAGKVKSIMINGSQGSATDRSGLRHPVNLPPDTAPLASTLSQEGVDVQYGNAGSTEWLQVLIPNLILLFLIGGFMYYLYQRRRLPPG